MIITKIQGGLGNQLFQYAAGLSLSSRNRTILQLDVSRFEFNSYREYRLSNMNIREHFASRNEIDLFFQNQTLLRIKKRFRKLYNDIFKVQSFPYAASLTYLQEQSNSSSLEILSTRNVYLEGFWQNYSYIIPEIEQQLRQEFTLRYACRPEVTFMEQQIRRSGQSLAIHVRRGDYVTDEIYAQRHGFIGLEYYRRAVDYVLGKVGECDIYIFTDDLLWVKTNFPDAENYTFVSGSSFLDFEELHLMATCHHQIIANSTFSWWGGWLNANPNKLVIAPKVWMLDASVKTEDLILQTWVAL